MEPGPRVQLTSGKTPKWGSLKRKSSFPLQILRVFVDFFGKNGHQKKSKHGDVMLLVVEVDLKATTSNKKDICLHL